MRRRGTSRTVRQGDRRALEYAPGAAQPSSIVATELAYARMSRDDGSARAADSYAGSSALLLTGDGAAPYDGARGSAWDPASAPEWGSRLVVKSCDGSLALSLGRLRDEAGLVGTYVTVWERQANGDFRWTHGVAGRDDPQPPPAAEVEEEGIVVTALNAVEGLVATCTRADETMPPPPSDPIGAATRTSRDGTLRWNWEVGPGGVRSINADYFYDGEWVRAIEERLSPPPRVPNVP